MLKLWKLFTTITLSFEHLPSVKKSFQEAKKAYMEKHDSTWSEPKLWEKKGKIHIKGDAIFFYYFGSAFWYYNNLDIIKDERDTTIKVKRKGYKRRDTGSGITVKGKGR